SEPRGALETFLGQSGRLAGPTAEGKRTIQKDFIWRLGLVRLGRRGPARSFDGGPPHLLRTARRICPVIGRPLPAVGRRLASGLAGPARACGQPAPRPRIAANGYY